MTIGIGSGAEKGPGNEAGEAAETGVGVDDGFGAGAGNEAGTGETTADCTGPGIASSAGTDGSGSGMGEDSCTDTGFVAGGRAGSGLARRAARKSHSRT